MTAVHVSGDRAGPILPYDLFEAANLFLMTGRTTDEVLPLIGLRRNEWDRLREVYRWFPYSYEDGRRRDYFRGFDDSEICRHVLPPRWSVPSDAAPDLRSTWHIREAVRRNPHIGPFADRGWPYTFIAEDAEASLCCYTHDGEIVYFDGKPLTNRKGARIAVDAASFKVVGGRWMRDNDHAYGQGQYGAGPTPYWYVVEGAELESYEALNLRYARDRHRAYYITGKTIHTKSPAAFEIVPELRLNYRDGTRDPLHKISAIARDQEAVYFYGTRLKGARPEHFHVLGHGYATDGETVWYLDDKKVIEGANAETFTVPGPGDPTVQCRTGGHAVTDRYRPYVDAKPCDPAKWIEAWRPFFETKSNLSDWWWHRIVNDAMPEA